MDSFEQAICVILIISIVIVVAGLAGFIYYFIKEIRNLTEKAKWVKLVPYTHLIQETIYFTGQILSEKKIRTYPAFKIYYCSHKKWAGMFNGVVIIYLKSNPDIPFLVNTTLHEVMHYMQMRSDRQYKLYDELTNTHGYWKNPFEVQAREFASIHCEPCLKYLESKQLIKRS